MRRGDIVHATPLHTPTGNPNTLNVLPVTYIQSKVTRRGDIATCDVATYRHSKPKYTELLPVTYIQSKVTEMHSITGS